MSLIVAICRYARLLSGLTIAASALTLLGIMAVIVTASLALGGLLAPFTEIQSFALAGDSISDFAGPAVDSITWAGIPAALFAVIAGFGFWCLHQVASPVFLSFASVRQIIRAIQHWMAVNFNFPRQIEVLAGALSPTAPHRTAVSTSAALAGAAPRLN